MATGPEHATKQPFNARRVRCSRFYKRYSLLLFLVSGIHRGRHTIKVLRALCPSAVLMTYLLLR